MLHQIPRRDDKVEEISMQILRGKPVERENRTFQRNLFSRVGMWKKTMGSLQGNSAPGRKWVL